jgi:hypothetical protein
MFLVITSVSEVIPLFTRLSPHNRDRHVAIASRDDIIATSFIAMTWSEYISGRASTPLLPRTTSHYYFIISSADNSKRLTAFCINRSLFSGSALRNSVSSLSSIIIATSNNKKYHPIE